MKICKIYVVRHGQSAHNRDDITSGHGDPELTELGRRQALATKTRLKAVHFDEVYSSDLQRASETATIIFGSPVPEDHKLVELRERNFGALDGQPNKKLQKIIEAYQSQYDQLSPDEKWRYKHVSDMESDDEVAKRFIRALTKIAQANLGKTILVGAHGGTLRTMLIGLKHGTVSDFPPGSIKNASFVELTYNCSSLSVDNAKDATNQPREADY